MDLAKIATLFVDVWMLLIQAPASFAALFAAIFAFAYLAAKWRYAGVIDALREQKETLNQRLIAKSEQSESYKERALKYDEKISEVVSSDSTELYTKASSFVARLRSFIDRRRNQVNRDLPYSPSDSEEDRRRDWERSTEAMMRNTSDTSAEWERDFKVDAMMLRDELRSRLDVPESEDLRAVYEHPTNFFGYEAVASDLERLAKSLSPNRSQ